jgi:hypothetical protein
MTGLPGFRRGGISAARKLPPILSEESMVEQVFGTLFLVALFAPAATVVAGVALLAWPRRHPRQTTLAHHAHARA